jgi:hypothetical protein
MKNVHLDILYSFVNLFFRLVSGPLTMILISVYLTPQEQGYWYLFGGITAFSVLADLGFTNIILQFSAHEFVKFKETGNNLVGSEYDLIKYGGLLKFIIKWTLKVLIILYPLIFIIGFYYLNRDHKVAVYIIPWIIFSLATVLSFVANVFISFFEGMNKISFVQKHRLISSIINSLLIALLLFLKQNLFALAIGMFISSSYLLFIILYQYYFIIEKLIISSKVINYNWNSEFIPLFKKYAISFASGFFILQMFIPLSHFYYGSVVAGKIGISLALVNSIFHISNIWIYTITPKINSLIAERKFIDLDEIFGRRIIYASLSYLFFFVIFLFIYYLRESFLLISNLFNRFLDLQSIFCLFTAYFFQLIINSWATYIRGFKIEPFVLPSFILSLYIIGVFLVIGNNFDYQYLFVGFLSSYLWWLPVSRYIFIKYKSIEQSLLFKNE